jgi:aspartyl-tRNA(Asn)/glutamyl-tRNA(Gln) amidotransferase subunit A
MSIIESKRPLWSISDYQHAYQIEEITIEEIFSNFLNSISNDQYNTFISSIKDVPAINYNESKILSGIPISVKDNICYTDFPTTCASKMLENWISPYNASVISFLLENHATIIGKTNLDEFAMGNSTQTSYFGKSYNPWDIHKRYSPGGSSGGSAISVALGYSPISIGSDTGGSIRCPASFTGVLGLKPTYGRVSRYGLISYAHTLDQIGIFARYAQDLSIVLEIISQSDVNDLTYQKKPYIHSNLEIDKPITVGVDLGSLEILPTIQKELMMNALAKLEEKEYISIQFIKIEDLDILLPTYYVTAFSEAYSNLVRYSGQQFGYDAGNIFSTRLQRFSEEVKRRYDLGSFSLKTGYDEQLYAKSQKIRSYYVDKFKNIFESVDIVALPTMLDAAFSWDECLSPIDSYKADLLTVPANLTGTPALSLPVGFIQKQGVNLPIGLQLIGSWWQEHKLIQLAYAYQQLSTFHLQLPPHPPQIE